MKEIFILSLLVMLHSSMIRAADIDCSGYTFYCPFNNMYLPCSWDEARNSTFTVKDRSEACPAGYICDTVNAVPCYADSTTVTTEEPTTVTTEEPTTVTTEEPTTVTTEEPTTVTPEEPATVTTEEPTTVTTEEPTTVTPEEPTTVTTEEPTTVTTEEPTTVTTEEPTTVTTEEPTTVTTEEPTTVTTEEPTTVTTEEPTTVTTEEPTTVTTEEPTTVTTEETATVTTEETATVTTELPTTVKVSPDFGELAGYTCASAGYYPHPTDCRRYIVCTVSATGLTYVNSQHQCDNDLVYHPDSHGCKLDATPCDNMNFKCVATGRFADPLNPSKYVWCLKMNGAFIVVKYSCPAGKIYDGNNACVEPTVINAMETLNLRKRSLELQSNDEADEELYEESGERVADRISLNSNEDASVYFRGKKYSNL